MESRSASFGGGLAIEPVPDSPALPWYSLWIVPPDPPLGSLRKIVAKFARRAGVPTFEPHVTLLGDLTCAEPEAREGARAVAGAADPFEVRFHGTGSEETFFRAAYLRVRRSAGLVETRKAAERFCADWIVGTESFDPHLSLAYGSPGEAMKRDLFDEARRSGLDAAAFVARRVTLAKASSELPIERWRVVGKVELGQPYAG